MGFGLGFITLIPVVILLTLLGVNVFDPSQPWTGAWVGERIRNCDVCWRC